MKDQNSKKQSHRTPYPNKPFQKEVFQALVLITQLGITMIVPIFFLTAAGAMLDQHLGTKFWAILLFFVGALSGGNGVYRILRKFLKRS
ncbi:MAG: AtpZ/AtpI family protein [Clostridium sp.]|jgi:hypothetical protein|nr:AtpZ/AtpI family protein [Clostridium sp.]